MAAKSPSEAMANPASSTSTPKPRSGGQAEFFLVVHGAAGGLLAVTQGGVEEDDVVRARHRIRSSVWT
jgi:hypothetical protein